MNVLIVEDEKYTADFLQEVVEQDRDFIVLDKLESIAEAIAYLSKYQKNLDLLLLDIELADGKSFEIFKHVDVVIPTIFCTAYDAYTLQAIKNNGIDYILKPFKKAELHQALNKYKKLVKNVRARPSVPIHFQEDLAARYQTHFLTAFREKTLLKRAEEVALFSIKNELVYLHTFNNERFPLLKKLEYIESVCDPSQFFRINRQMLINRNAIIAFEPYFNRKIILQLQIHTTDKAIVSRMKVSTFKNWLTGL